jgi:hypothetical protein
MARANTRIRYALAVVDDIEKARHFQPAQGDGLRYVEAGSLKTRRRDVRNGVDRDSLCISLTRNLSETHLYSSEEGAWLDNLELGLNHSGVQVVKLRIANRESGA